MDPLTLYLVGTAFSTIFGLLGSDYNRTRSFGDQINLQNDAQDFNHEEAELERNWQEDMYNKYMSPKALLGQYSDMGASPNAALMAALGVSPSVPSGASASSGMNSQPFVGNTMSELMQSFQNSINSFYDNEIKKNQAENLQLQNQWLPKLNQNAIDRSLAEIDNLKGRLKLDNTIFNEVTKPLAQSTIGLNSVEIDKKKQEIANLRQEYENLKATYRNINADTGLKFAQSGLVGAQTGLAEAQTLTESYKQNNLAADTGLKISETDAANLQNRLTRLTVNMSEAVGFDINVKPVNLLLSGASHGYQETFKKLDDIFHAADTTLRYVGNSLDFQGKKDRAFYLTKKFFDITSSNPRLQFSPQFDRWLHDKGKHFKDYENWINRNTRYE